MCWLSSYHCGADATELLDIETLSSPGFTAPDRFGRLQGTRVVQAEPAQNSANGGWREWVSAAICLPVQRWRRAPGFVLQRHEQDGLGTTNEGGGTAEKMRVHDTAAGRSNGPRAFRRRKECRHGCRPSVIAPVSLTSSSRQFFSPATPLGYCGHTEQSRNYWVKQLSKPSVICLLGRLRPMKTIRLSRFSSFFHGL